MTVGQDMEKSRSQSMLRCFSILFLDYDIDHILVLAGGGEGEGGNHIDFEMKKMFPPLQSFEF
jgi:hypothetical protein